MHVTSSGRGSPAWVNDVTLLPNCGLPPDLIPRHARDPSGQRGATVLTQGADAFDLGLDDVCP